jgi:hypothetical protein
MSVPENYHKHKCVYCGYVWQHHDVNDVSHGDYGAHECPQCERCNWGLGIYTGDESPAVVNGKIPPDNKAVTMHPDQLSGGVSFLSTERPSP